MPPTVAIPCHPTLDGFTLKGADTSQWVVRHTSARGVQRAMNGSSREGLLTPAPGYPSVQRKIEVTFEWASLGAMRPDLEELLSVPGVHELVIWRTEIVSWLCDGVRREFFLPWKVARHVVEPDNAPGTDQTTNLPFGDPLVKVGRDGATLTYSAENGATYASTDPAEGAVMFLANGQRFKLEEAPTAGSRIYARIIPLYRVLRSGEPSEKSLRDAMREPARETLIEV
jgi:hypothetical protein